MAVDLLKLQARARARREKEKARRMEGRGVVDTRNLLDRDNWVGKGFDYVGIGR